MPADQYYLDEWQKIADIDLAKYFTDPEAQARFSTAFQQPPSYRAPEARIENSVLNSPHGDLPIRVYSPRSGTPNGIGLVWAHDGGWGFGSIDDPGSDAVAREIVARTGGVVVTFDYHLVNEAVRYPIPLDDYQAAWEWTVANAERIGIDPARLSLGGGGVAANMSVGVALRLRDAGKPLPAGLLVPFPLMHLPVPALPAETEQNLSVVAPLFRFGAPMVQMMYQGYLGDAFEHPDAYAVPATADLAGLPRTLIFTSEYDDLVPSGEDFARLLDEAGVEVEYFEEKGVGHAHINHTWADGAQRSLDALARWLSKVGASELTSSGHGAESVEA